MHNCKNKVKNIFSVLVSWKSFNWVFRSHCVAINTWKESAIISQESSIITKLLLLKQDLTIQQPHDGCFTHLLKLDKHLPKSLRSSCLLWKQLTSIYDNMIVMKQQLKVRLQFPVPRALDAIKWVTAAQEKQSQLEHAGFIRPGKSILYCSTLWLIISLCLSRKEQIKPVCFILEVQ